MTATDDGRAVLRKLRELWVEEALGEGDLDRGEQALVEGEILVEAFFAPTSVRRTGGIIR